jgi:site-specific recombinase XerD
MLDAGADINVVKEILGHESLAATQEYTKVQLPKGARRLPRGTSKSKKVSIAQAHLF